jgi:competence protein ComEC
MTASMDMYFLDVGQGDSTYLEVGEAGKPNFENYLIDFGYKQRQFNGDHPAYQSLRILVDLISKSSKKRGLTSPQLSRLFITHPDGDHWNMIAALIDGTDRDGTNLWVTVGGWKKEVAKLTLNALVFGAAASDYSKKGDGWLTIIDALDDPTHITRLGDQAHDAQSGVDGAVGPRWTGVGGALKIYLINSNYPKRDGKDAPNPKSLCLIFEYDGFKLLLMGDAEPETVGEKLKSRYAYNNYEFLRCDALKLAHHGSRAGTPEWWPKIVKPKYAFVSGDYFWAHPYYEALENVYDANTLNGNFFKHWVAAYKDNLGDYGSDSTPKAMFSSLWYVVTSSNPQTAKNQKDVSLQYGKGTYIGVAWLLQKFKGQAKPGISYAPDDVWPGINAVPA